MEALALMVVGLAVGLAVRPWLGGAFSKVFRGYLLAAVGSLAFMAGWAFEFETGDISVMSTMLAGEMCAIGIAAAMALRRRMSAVAAVTVIPNTGIYPVPLAVAMFGAKAAVFVVVFDMLFFWMRLGIAVALLRRLAPVRQARTTALTDYFPSVALVAGFLLQLVVPSPAGIEEPLGILAYAVAIGGMVIFGIAISGSVPRRSDYREVAGVPILRFGIVPALLGGLALAGVEIPPPAWIVAFAPTFFNSVPLARLYGYRSQVAFAAILLTIVVALASLPTIAALT